jgi:protein CpxP
MMRRLLIVVGFLAVVAGRGAAQENTPSDSARAEQLRQEVETRFAARVKDQLGLTEDQSRRMQTTVRGYFQNRRMLEMEEQRLRREVGAELRPGVAADSDRLNRLLDDLVDVRVRYAQSYRDESRELAKFLTPVQRGQYFMMRERLFDQVREFQRQRGGPRQPRAWDRP